MESAEPALPNDDGDDDQTSCEEVEGSRPVTQPGGGDSTTLPNGGPITPSVMMFTSTVCRENDNNGDGEVGE